MAPSRDLSISCHCGAAKQIIRLRDGSPQDISLCHCAACRHSTGLLCVSYAGIETPGCIDGLVAYCASPTLTRFFCVTCGCHVFRKLWLDGIELWDVATGVISGSCEGDEVLMRYSGHVNVAGTKDGGLSRFIRIGGLGVRTPGASDADLGGSRTAGRGEELLNASCHCGTVRFHITRPDAASRLPRSAFPDLMVPFHTGSPVISNPGDDKWWLRPGLGIATEESEPGSPGRSETRRYLAGTCACRSCRLVSGFEIQTWAFVPRANIFFHVREGQRSLSTSSSHALTGTGDVVVPLDFATLPPGILTSYESTEGVRREFCSKCGATVFWRDRWRPELLDVSAGLLDAEEGALAETWLDWWTGRVSFSEDAGAGRVGGMARLARDLIGSLEEGLRAWGRDTQEENDCRD